MNERDGGLGGDAAHRLHLWPFGEFVDGHEEEHVAPNRSGQGPDDVKTLDRERPRDGDRLQ